MSLPAGKLWKRSLGSIPAVTPILLPAFVLGGPFLASLAALRVQLSDLTAGINDPYLWCLVTGIETASFVFHSSVWVGTTSRIDGSLEYADTQDLILLDDYIFITAAFG